MSLENGRYKADKSLDISCKWEIEKIINATISLEEKIKLLSEEKTSLLNSKSLQIMTLKNVSLRCEEYNKKNFKTPEEWEQHIEKEYEKAKQNEEYNKNAIENNKQILDFIVKTLKQFNINTEEYAYKTSRSSKKTKMTTAWYDDICKRIPTGTYCTSLKGKKAEADRNIKKWRADIEREEQQKQREKENKQKEAERLALLGSLSQKYLNRISTDIYEIISSILEKNKYLHLAHYLNKNRGDWNDGYHYAEIGLSNFSQIPNKSTKDKEIIKNISDVMENNLDFPDGRIFRDCEYNYDVLFNMVEDKDLMKDYYKILDMDDLF